MSVLVSQSTIRCSGLCSAARRRGKGSAGKPGKRLKREELEVPLFDIVLKEPIHCSLSGPLNCKPEDLEVPLFN